MLLEFDLQHDIVVNVLEQVQGNLQNDAMLKDIGEHLVATTQDRFRTSTAPDGSRWQENSSVTLWNTLEDRHFRRDGTVNRRGQHRFNSKKPLIGVGQNGGALQDIAKEK
ncbi:MULTISPECIES: phage virion morphogenesis protein [unclassified Acinetobacter]|uniref:phage virion morphogenesis protein n=1 Tax=unclassified Acinetobacter TaxID=196816 RepID=UPI0035B8809E